jgi:metal-responsive CopG/Arc/MetJ family transcriptional regulator
MQKRTTILINSDLLERLDRFSARSGVTKTSVLTSAVEAYLEAHDTTPDLSRSDHGRLSLDGRSIAQREAGMRPGPDEL